MKPAPPCRDLEFAVLGSNYTRFVAIAGDSSLIGARLFSAVGRLRSIEAGAAWSDDQRQALRTVAVIVSGLKVSLGGIAGNQYVERPSWFNDFLGELDQINAICSRLEADINANHNPGTPA
ncbi:MAG: hypothetical protein ACSLFQ_01505 [Thermoanaerobaculia bacterium]